MYLVKLWDRYDREIFINIHKKATPPRRTLEQIVKVFKTLLIRSGISKKRRIK